MMKPSALLLAACALMGPALSAYASSKVPRPAIELPFMAGAPVSTYHPLPRTDVLITGATVLDGDGHRLDKADVLVHDGKIAAVGPHLKAGPGVETVDAHGKWVTPGIIDDHSHDGTYAMPLTSVDTQASDVAETATPEEEDTWILNGIDTADATFLYALKNGVTTMQVLPGSTPLMSGRAVTVHPIPAPSVTDMMVPDAPAGAKMACGDNAKLHFGPLNQKPNSRGAEIAMLREAFSQARTYRDAWLKYARTGRGEPPVRDVKLDTLVGILDGDLRLNIHCYRADDMNNWTRVAHEFNFKITAFHHAVEAYKTPQLFIDNHICAVVWPDWWGFKMEANDGIRENAAILDHDGICVTMHSDGPVIGQRLNIEAAKAAAAGRRIGFSEPPEHVIAWITSNPAKVLGLDSRMGSLRPGYDGDVVVWSGDPFSIYSHADLVLVDGARVYDRFDPAYQPKSDFQLGRPAGEEARQ